MKSPAIIPLSFVVAAAGCGGAEPAPSGGPTPPFSALEVTAMSLRHDLARPLEAGHALPLHFSVRSASPSDENHLTAEVQALVTLVEVSTAAPETRRRCEVGSDLLQVPLDGRPVSYDEPLVIPLECLPTGMTAADYNIEVQLVVGSRTDPDTAPEGFRSTFLFDAANVASDERPERTCRLNGSETSRCGVALRLNPSGGFHLVAGIRPMSSVGVIWPRTVQPTPSPMNAPTEPTPMGPGMTAAPLRSNLDVELETRTFGGNPNREGDEAERLPGPVRVSFAIAPAAGEHVGDFQDVPFRTLPTSDEPERMSITFDRLPTASRDQGHFYLFLPQAVETMMTTGPWAGDDRYSLRVCETPVGWNEDDNDDDEDPDLTTGESRADAQHCRTASVRFARSLAATTTTALRYEPLNFDRSWSASSIGGGRMLARYLVESNSTRHGAELVVRPSISFRSYNRDILDFDLSSWVNTGSYVGSRARARLAVLGFTIKEENLTLAAQNGHFETGVSVQLPQIRKEFGYEQQFMLGPVPVTARFALGGAISASGNVGFDGDIYPDRNNGTAGITTFTPTAALNASVSAAVGTRWVSAGVRGNLTLVRVNFPIDSRGITFWRPNEPNTIFGAAGVNIRCAMNFLAGNLELFIKIDPPGPGSKTFTRSLCSWGGISGYGDSSGPTTLFAHGQPWVQIR